MSDKSAIILMVLFTGFALIVTPSVLSTFRAEDPGTFAYLAGPWIWLIIVFLLIVATIFSIFKK